jgi:hypothetical protein
MKSGNNLSIIGNVLEANPLGGDPGDTPVLMPIKIYLLSSGTF